MLEDFISTERLKIYSLVLKLKPTEELAGYNWNKALSSAMQPLMHCLEVTLRNALDQAIRHLPPLNPARPWRNDQYWIFDLPRYRGDLSFKKPADRYQTDWRGNLQDGSQGRPLKYNKTLREEKQIREIREKLRKENKQATPERVIAGLNFGFWTNLLSADYEEPRTQRLLWPALLPVAFPGAPNGIKRHHIADKFNRIRDLRNRLAHHEAIWKFYHPDPVTQKPDYQRPVYGLVTSLNLLNSAWQETLEALYWLSPDRHQAFLAAGHHRRFEALASKDGLHSFIDQAKLTNTLNVRRSIKHLLRELESGRIVRVNNGDKTYAIVGPDFIQQ